MGREFIERYFLELNDAIGQVPLHRVERVVQHIYRAYQNGKQVFILGNGGSASTASHFCCDLGKGAVVDGKPRLRVMSLNDNMALLSAYANDFGYESIFVEQMKNLVQEGDVVICITASGNSPNVIQAIEFANEAGTTTIGLLGFGGGKAREMVAEHVTIDNSNYGQVEDVHMFLAHCVSQCFREWVTNGGPI